MKQTRLLAFLLASTALFAGNAWAQQISASDVGKVTVDTPAEQAPGNGYIIPEDGGKERSTVTREAIERRAPSSNIYQLLDHTPGVNAQSTDGTGLFGGQLSVRGFDASEIGFTIAGVPVNDSGNYAVYPQEYVDPENLQEISITQGAPDPDQPQGGAVGGAVSIVPQEPTEQRRIRIVQGLGNEDYFKSYARLDTGDLFDTTFRFFISYSKAEADKFKGPGNADDDHIDFGAVYETPGGSKFSAYSYFNTAINDQFESETLAQFDTYGRSLDYEPNFYPFPPAVKGTAQNQSGSQANLVSAYPNLAYNYANYYKFHVNPFTNEIASFTADLKLTDTLRASIQPYYWNGYGNGGGTGSISESSTTSAYNGYGSGGKPVGYTGPTPYASVDLNGDTDLKDTILYYRPSITSTQRPGVNSKFTYEALDWDTIRFGLDYDHSRHHQTQPYETIGYDGQIDVWANDNDALLHRADGTLVQGRDQTTFNDTKIAYFENTSTFLNDTAKIVLAIKRQETDRDGTNNLPFAVIEGGSVYHPSVDYLAYLPSIQASYKITEENQIFANLQKNARAPSNYTLYESVLNTIGDQDQETSWNLDVGYRFQNSVVLASISAFAIDFKNRQLDIALPDDPTNTTDINAGTVHNRGVEFEIGTSKPIYDVNLYGSASYTKSIIEDNLPTGIPASGATPAVTNFIVPTAGKVYPNTPKWLISGTASYSPSFFPGSFIGISPKWTSAREATLVNDQKVPGYAKVDLFAGYAVPDDMVSVVNNVKIQFNVDNLFSRNYLFFGYGASSTGINAFAVKTKQGTLASSGTPTYGVGSPAFFGVKLSADF